LSDLIRGLNNSGFRHGYIWLNVINLIFESPHIRYKQ